MKLNKRRSRAAARENPIFRVLLKDNTRLCDLNYIDGFNPRLQNNLLFEKER
jgi:hypothetical protein